MSGIDLDAIRARERAATAGPWSILRNGLQQSCGIIDAECGLVPHTDNTSPFGKCGVTEPDHDFIAHARTDVPALLAEVERLRAIVAKLPVTADGVAVVPRIDDVYFPGGERTIERSAAWRLNHLTNPPHWVNPNGRPVSSGYADPDMIVRPSLEALRARAGEGEKGSER